MIAFFVGFLYFSRFATRDWMAGNFTQNPSLPTSFIVVWGLHIACVMAKCVTNVTTSCDALPWVCNCIRNVKHYWLVVWNIFYFPTCVYIYIYWLGMSLSQLTFIFFRGIDTTKRINFPVIDGSSLSFTHLRLRWIRLSCFNGPSPMSHMPGTEVSEQTCMWPVFQQWTLPLLGSIIVHTNLYW